MDKQYEVVYRTPARPTRDDRAEWLEIRRQGVGASDRLNNSTLKLKVGYQDTFKGNDRTVLGHLLEDDIISFANYKGFCARGSQAVLRSLRYPEMMCTLDGVVRMPLLEKRTNHLCKFLLSEMKWESKKVLQAVNYKELSVFEIKAPGYDQLDKWLGATPLNYWRQVQHQLAVTGFDVGWLVALVDKQLITKRIERDQAFIDKRAAECKTFMAEVARRRKLGH